MSYYDEYHNPGNDAGHHQPSIPTYQPLNPQSQSSSSVTSQGFPPPMQVPRPQYMPQQQQFRSASPAPMMRTGSPAPMMRNGSPAPMLRNGSPAPPRFGTPTPQYSRQPYPRYGSPAPSSINQPPYQSRYTPSNAPSNPFYKQTYPPVAPSSRSNANLGQTSSKFDESDDEGSTRTMTLRDEYASATEKGLKPSQQSKTNNLGPGASTRNAALAAALQPKAWNSFESDAFEKKKRFCKSPLRTCCCISLILFLIIAGVIAGFVLWARPPNVAFQGIVNHPDGLPQFNLNGVTFDFNLGLKMTVQNPNFVGATFSLITADVFDPAAPTIRVGGGNLTNVSFQPHSNQTIIFPFTIEYSPLKDPNGVILNDIASKCSSGQQLSFNLKLGLHLKVIAISIPINLNQKTQFSCPSALSGNVQSLLSGILGQ